MILCRRQAQLGWVAVGRVCALSTAAAPISFKELRLAQDVVQSVKQWRGVDGPSPVQVAAIPRVLSGDSIVIAAPTGSGKTLAYVLPLVHQLRSAPRNTTSLSRPRAVVLAPSAELARQILDVIKTVSKCAPIASAGAFETGRLKNMEAIMDVLVTTPGRLQHLLRDRRIFLSQLRLLILDEADTLLDESFSHDTLLTLQPALASLEAAVPCISIVATAGVHNVPAEITHEFVRVRGGDDGHLAALVAVLLLKTPGKTIVFCNTVESLQRVWAHLTTAATATTPAPLPAGVPVLALHGHMAPMDRKRALAAFAARTTALQPAGVLVATDLAARGLDVPAVSRVVLFDFPTHIAAYLHRAGRTGRAHRAGTVFSLIRSRDAERAEALEAALNARELVPGLSRRVAAGVLAA